MDEISKAVLEIFRDVFPKAKEINEQTKAGDIHAWDSLNHMVLISKIEEKFELSFELDEILEMQSFGQICKAVLQKQNN